MKAYKYVAVVLVYRNADDLKECIESFHEKLECCKIIIVNSYYDNFSKATIENIATDKNCDFINVENKGYSFGNNCGIDYAKEHYNFQYLIISNPDITIRHFDEKVIDDNKDYGIFAPKIIARSGRLQNPMCVIQNRLVEKLEYYGFKKDRKILVLFGIVIGKLLRELIIFFHKQSPYSIYAAHGSFVIMAKATIDKLYPLYDENIFLFAEEAVLASRAKKAGIKTGQFNQIVISHKEDGSMKLSNISINDELKKANIYYYEKYVLGIK